jgi:F420-dependent oxidoreductase-like protein
VEIIRKILAREGPVEFDGAHYQLPLQGGTGLGKALKSTVHPLRTDLPIFIAAEGPKNVALSAEIADGWLPFWFSPKSDAFYRQAMAEGFARTGARHTVETFEVPCPVPLVVNEDVEAAANVVRPMLALYVGGMGAKGANFHYEVIARLGYHDECAQIQELYLSGDRAAAIAAVPLRMVEDVALVGPPQKIREELPRWEATTITTMLVSGPPPLLELVAGLVG